MTEAGALTGYRDRVYEIAMGMMRRAGVTGTGVDVGAGEGWYAHRLLEDGVLDRALAIDVTRRQHEYLPVVQYDGARLPVDDRTAEIVYAIDVLHHAHSPIALLHEMMRATNRWLLLKDHTWRSSRERWLLAVLDEIGNRRFGIPSPGRYQQGWEWIEELESHGFVVRDLRHPAKCQNGLLGRLTNPLQFVVLAERADAR